MGEPQIWIELFAILNVGFLTFDIYLAHSVNQFRNQAEYIPLIFSATAPAAADPRARRALSLAGGLEGSRLSGRLDRRADRADRSHSSSAEPFLLRTHPAQPDLLRAVCRAPGLHRPRISAHHEPHGRSGNARMGAMGFACSPSAASSEISFSACADHAGNGFFNPLEWVPVVASAIAVGFLAVPLLIASLAPVHRSVRSDSARA